MSKAKFGRRRGRVRGPSAKAGARKQAARPAAENKVAKKKVKQRKVLKKKVARKTAHEKARRIRTRTAAKTLSPRAARRRGAAATDPFLGNARAVSIVCSCANTIPANLGRTLTELGVDGPSFQLCVFNRVGAAGYSISLDAIPSSPDTRLIDVVNVIQHAPRTR